MDSIIRNQIQFWIESGKSTTWIARELGKHPSTIWLELLKLRGQSFSENGIEVTLHPFLLGAKFQRIADKTVLRKSGVITKKPDNLKK